MLDVLIAGGGANGLTLALALGQHTDLSVGIVEAKAYEQDASHPGFDARVLALAKASHDILLQFGLYELSAICEPIKYIHVSDTGHLGQCQLDHTDYQLDALGYVVELDKLGQMLRDKLQRLPENRLQWFCPDKIIALAQQQEHTQVTLQSGQSLQTKLLVVAEGGHSPTRDLLKLDASSSDYSQVGLITNVTLDRDHKNVAYERFTENGPLALLPMRGHQGNHQFSLVWSIPPEQESSFLNLSDAVFLNKLQHAFGFRAGRFIQSGQRFCYPLALIQAQEFTTHRGILLGNSAQTLHPIAGQGLNLGLRDMMDLFECLQKAEQAQQDVGSYAVLKDYRDRRQQDKHNTIGLTNNLVKLFSNQYLPFVVGRNTGLFALQILPQAKAQFAAQSMGLKQLHRILS